MGKIVLILGKLLGMKINVNQISIILFSSLHLHMFLLLLWIILQHV